MISFSYRISFSKILTKNYVFHVYFIGNYSHKAGNLKRMQITTPDELLCTVYELCARTHFHYIYNPYPRTTPNDPWVLYNGIVASQK